MPVPVADGVQPLIEALDQAVRLQDTQQIVNDVKDCLVELISNGRLEIPEPLCRPRPDCYARRLVHRCPEGRYEAIAMIWGPGQGTPLHDHAGIWCVEGVYRGEIEVCQYDLIRQRDNRFLFKACETIQARLGMAGSLIPPYEYHTIANALDDAPSITLHVYGGRMEYCHAFEPLEEGWFVRRRKPLAYHA